MRQREKKFHEKELQIKAQMLGEGPHADHSDVKMEVAPQEKQSLRLDVKM